MPKRIVVARPTSKRIGTQGAGSRKFEHPWPFARAALHHGLGLSIDARGRDLARYEIGARLFRVTGRKVVPQTCPIGVRHPFVSEAFRVR